MFQLLSKTFPKKISVHISMFPNLTKFCMQQYTTMPRKYLTVVIANVFLCATHEGMQETRYSSTLS